MKQNSKGQKTFDKKKCKKSSSWRETWVTEAKTNFKEEFSSIYQQKRFRVTHPTKDDCIVHRDGAVKTAQRPNLLVIVHRHHVILVDGVQTQILRLDRDHFRILDNLPGKVQHFVVVCRGEQRRLHRTGIHHSKPWKTRHAQKKIYKDHNRSFLGGGGRKDRTLTCRFAPIDPGGPAGKSWRRLRPKPVSESFSRQMPWLLSASRARYPEFRRWCGPGRRRPFPLTGT